MQTILPYKLAAGTADLRPGTLVKHSANDKEVKLAADGDDANLMATYNTAVAEKGSDFVVASVAKVIASEVLISGDKCVSDANGHLKKDVAGTLIVLHGAAAGALAYVKLA